MDSRFRGNDSDKAIYQRGAKNTIAYGGDFSPAEKRAGLSQRSLDCAFRLSDVGRARVESMAVGLSAVEGGASPNTVHLTKSVVSSSH